MKHHGFTIGAVIFALVGSAMLFGSYYSYTSTTEFLEAAEHAEGVVVDLIAKRSSSSNGGSSYSYYPLVEFRDKNSQTQRFEGDVGSSPAAFERGEKVKVLYDPQIPKEAKINTFMQLYFFPLFLGGMGLLFALGGYCMLYFKTRKVKRIKRLKERGQRISTKVTAVEFNTSFKVNGRSPWVIRSEWQNPRSGEMISFRSENIWFDPSEYLKDQQVQVLIDMENPSINHMDTSFLPEKK